MNMLVLRECPWRSQKTPTSRAALVARTIYPRGKSRPEKSGRCGTMEIKIEQSTKREHCDMGTGAGRGVGRHRLRRVDGRVQERAGRLPLSVEILTG